MKPVLRGRVVRIDAHDVSTDVIAPTFWVHLGRGEHDLATLRPHAFESLRPGLNDNVQQGDILVVGRNFGAGSHREEAVLILQVWGVSAVIAESAARIYFRNSIAAGLPLIQLPGALDMFGEGDTVELNLEQWSAENVTRGERVGVPAFPTTIMRILNAGGIIEVVKAQMASAANDDMYVNT